MTSGLRKLHKWSWLLIAIVGMVFLFFTIRSLDFKNSKPNKGTEVENTKPNF